MDHKDMMGCPPSLLERGGLKPQPEKALKCPRCESTNTKFCYYNNYSLSQPRYFCKTCRRYWTKGGTLRNVPVGGSCRKNKRVKRSTPDQSLARESELTSTTTHGEDHNNNNNFRSCCTLDSDNIAGLSNSMYYGPNNNTNDIIHKIFPRIQEAVGDGFTLTNCSNSDILGPASGSRPSVSNYLSPMSSLANVWAANSTQLRPISSSTFPAPGFNDKSLKWVDHEAVLCPADPNSIMESHQQISQPGGVQNFGSFTMDCGLNRVHPDRVQWRLQEQHPETEGHGIILLEGQTVEQPCRQTKALEDFMSSFGCNKGGLGEKEWRNPTEQTNCETVKDSIYWNGRSWPYLPNYASSSVSPLI